MELSSCEIRRLDDDAGIGLAWAVVHQLRPQLDRGDLIAAVANQRSEGYRCVGLFVEGVCLGFAGYRIQTMLAHGRFLYVDDLVTEASERGSGYGSQLLDWLVAEAKQEGCHGLQLDSGTQRLDAHAFYFRRGLRVTSFHFVQKF